MKMRMIVALAGASVFAYGCGGAPTGVDSEPSAGVVDTSRAETVAAAPQAGEVVIDGRTYIPVADDWKPPPVNISIPTKDMNIDQLAAATTGVVREMNVDGTTQRTLRAAEPNYDLARLIQEGSRDLTPGSIPGLLSTSPAHTDFLFKPSAPNQPSAWDPRMAENLGNYPFRTVVYIQTNNGTGPSSGGWCSGTYVGPHGDTLITAAHCVYNPVVFASRKWVPITTFTPAAVGSDGSGTVTYAEYGSFNGCFRSTIPQGWISNNCPSSSFGACDSFDYAVIDFRPCGNPTIAQTGTMGVAWNQTGLPNIHTDGYPAPYNVTGNPQDTVTPGTTIAGGFGAYPFECGMTGPVKNNGSTVESESLSVSQGDSGGPWWETINNTPSVIAITTGDRQYFDFTSCPSAQSWVCSVNYGRWIDTSVINFINTYSLL